VVVLPEVSDEQVPNAGKFEIAEGPDRCCSRRRRYVQRLSW
jgi:hypothetical protein